MDFSSQISCRWYIRTLVEIAKTMIYSAGIKLYCWPYAIRFSAFVRNMVVTSATDYKIAIYRLFNMNPSFEQMYECRGCKFR
jgi:hypothetical protein